MSTINIPREPNDALLRPFIGCPSAELPEAWAAMVRVAEGQNARAGTAPAALLTKPARVGGGSFGVGVPERYVIEAAQRLHAQEGERSAMTAEEFADEERKRRTLWELIHGPLAAVPQAPAQEASAADGMSQAARDVLAERHQQVAAEGHSAERDDGYNASELAYAAAWYATPPCSRHVLDVNDMGLWPITWPTDSFKPGDRRRELVKSSALAIAEVERMDRAKAQTNGGSAT